MDFRAQRIALVAGEASGDGLGATLIEGLKARLPDVQFAGVGGPRMRAAGFEGWHDIGELSVMGLAEVVRHLPRLLRLRGALRRRIIDWDPDVAIGIDAPDFNLGLERRLRRAGFPTAHYVSPAVWAWREGRAKSIGRSADLVLCLFPMEPAIYARHGVDARFVGHPLADAFPLDPDRAVARANLGVTADAPVLALLPGSRVSEVRMLAPDFIGAVQRLRREFADLAVLAPMANAACALEFRAALARADTPVTVLDGGADAAMTAANAVLLASGTATLEAMMCKRPMVAAYRVAPTTYRMVKWARLLKSPHVALPNILAGRALVPERLQHDCTPDALAAAVAPLLRAREPDPALLGEFRRLHLALRTPPGGSAADIVAAFLAARTA